MPLDGGLENLVERRELRELASRYSADAKAREEKAEKSGRHHRRVYFVTSIGAVVAGVVAGVAGLAESEPLVTGIAGFTASALAAIAPTVDAKRLAEFHFRQGAEYGAISRLFEILATRSEEPTTTAMEDLIERLAKCKERQVGSGSSGPEDQA